MLMTLDRMMERYGCSAHRKPSPMSYKGYDVTGLVPEQASCHDAAFIAWSERADEYIAIATKRGWDKSRIESGLAEVVKYPA